MLPFEDRYTRQRQLPEVGEVGQARLAAATFVLPPMPGHEIELLYLKRAGAGSIELQHGGTAEPFPYQAEFQHDGPVEFAAAAYRALKRIRRQLEIL